MLGKGSEIIDREPEWARLKKAWESGRSELIFVLGRRRVGKSYLLARFARAADGIYYQATERTEAEQLASLTRIVAERFSDPALRQVDLPSWEALFSYLTERAGEEPFLLILDEFPYLESAAPALPSILQSWWDQQWQGVSAKVVLSGSHITAMRRMEAEDQPLYGRRTARLLINPFSYLDTGAFLPGYTARERLLAYGIFGGLGGHLGLLDPARTVGANVEAQILDSSGRLVDEAQHMLDAFLGEAEVHYSIVQAIANGDQTWSGITSRVGKQSGSLSRPARWLIDMQVIARVVPITEKQPDKSKRALYRITDPYVAFWHRFISALVSTGAIGLVEPKRLWQQIAPKLDDYMGPVFEEACRAFCWRPGSLPFEVIRVGEWWDSDSQNQIDVVALGGAGEVLFGECKWGTPDLSDLARLRQRAERLQPDLPNVRQVQLALFCGAPLDDPQLLAMIEQENVLIFTLEDLFRSW